MTPLVERRTITLNFGRPVTVYAEVARSGLKDSTPWVVICLLYTSPSPRD